MLIINLMIILLFIYSIVLLSGVKIINKSNYTRISLFLFIVYTPMVDLIEGYMLGYIGISNVIAFSVLFIAIFIWGYRVNKYLYSIHNVKKDDVIDIITSYLETRSIAYEIREVEIYLPDIYRTIYIKGSTEVILDCKEIKDMDLYHEIIKGVSIGIKEIKRKYFSIQGMTYMALAGVLYWMKIDFLADFLK